MRSIISAAAIAATLSTAQSAPSIPGITSITNILSGPLPSDPKALATWASSRGLAFDPNYKHVPSPSDIPNIHHVSLPSSLFPRSPSSPSANLSLPLFPGSLPSSSSPILTPRNINPPDDRYQYTNPSAFPWRAVGKIQWSNGVSCTGQLIGPRHVLTARHCIPQDGQQVSLSFSPAFDKGPNKDPKFGTAAIGTAVYGANPGGECGIKLDSAVAIIDRRMGDALGWFGLDGPTGSFWNQKIFTTLGYPGDRDGGQRPYRMDGSQLPNPGRKPQFSCDGTSGPIFSDTDIYSGQSGSALWKDYGIVWGVCAAQIGWADGYSMAGWASGDDMVKMVNYTRYNWA